MNKGNEREERVRQNPGHLKEENGQAQVECAAFLRDLSATRDSVRNDHGLTKEDMCFVDGRLQSLQKKGERLLENLPFGLSLR